jgi:hypothetical protein
MATCWQLHSVAGIVSLAEVLTAGEHSVVIAFVLECASLALFRPKWVWMVGAHVEAAHAHLLPAISEAGMLHHAPSRAETRSSLPMLGFVSKTEHLVP